MEVVIPTQNDVSSLDQIVTLLSSFSCIKKIHIVNNNVSPVMKTNAIAKNLKLNFANFPSKEQ